ncbi:hypothetical protein KSP39_PZI001632 [Platanthera zijinensis]|uniref:Uncharacterized protein n=1 Tax=Platanthera zijinensis TaxID=2320716 RepID=A0AAP0GDU8_9ASPA
MERGNGAVLANFIKLLMLPENCEAFLTDKSESLTEDLQSYAVYLKSCQSERPAGSNNHAQGLLELKRLQNSWTAVVLCLFEVGKTPSNKVDTKTFSVKGSLIPQVIQKVRELPSESRCHLLS